VIEHRRHFDVFAAETDGRRFSLYKNSAFLPHKVLGGGRISPSALLLANAQPVFCPFSYGRATRQNDVLYKAFSTVSVWSLASHSYLFRGVQIIAVGRH